MSLGTIRCILHTHKIGTDVVDAVYWFLISSVANPKTKWTATSFCEALRPTTIQMVESLLGESRRLEVALFLLYTGREW